MPLNFPTTGLTANETQYTFENNTWIWNGYAWDSVVTPNSVGLTAYVRTWNGQTGDVVFSNYVTSINGTTGAVTNIAKTDTAQTFTAIQSFALGFTANGATFTNNLHAGTIKGGQLNVQNTTSNIIGDYTNTLGGGYIQIDNSSGQAFNRIAGTLYTDAVRIGSVAVPALNVTGSIYTSGLINTTARVSCAGITSSGVSTFTGSLTSNNLYVSQGATFNSNAVFVSGLSADDIWVTNGATFAARSSFNAGLSSSNLWVTNGATFNSAVTFNANPTIQGAFSALTIRDTMGATMSLNPSGVSLPIIQVYKDTGSQTLQFNPSATNPVVTLPSTTTTLAGLGVTQSFTTAQTFTAIATFNSGLTANTLMVASGATFFGNADFRSGLSADDIWITNGATFSSRSSFNAGLSASNLWVTNGATFASNIFAPNIVTSVNGSTGAVITYVGTTGNIPYRYGSGVGITANNFFTVAADAVGTQTDIFKFSGATSIANETLYGNTEAKGLIINRFYDAGLGLDEAGGVEIQALGQYNDGSDLWGSNLYLTTPAGLNFGGNIVFKPRQTDVLTVENTQVYATVNIVSTGSISATQFSDTYSFVKTYRTTTSATTANQTIATVEGVYDSSEIPEVMGYPAFEVTISARDTVLNKTEMLKMLVVQNGTDTVNTQYGLIRTGLTGPVQSYSTTLQNTAGVKDLLIRATPSSANSTKFNVTVRAHNA